MCLPIPPKAPPSRLWMLLSFKVHFPTSYIARSRACLSVSSHMSYVVGVLHTSLHSGPCSIPVSLTASPSHTYVAPCSLYCQLQQHGKRIKEKTFGQPFPDGVQYLYTLLLDKRQKYTNFLESNGSRGLDEDAVTGRSEEFHANSRQFISTEFNIIESILVSIESSKASLSQRSK